MWSEACNCPLTDVAKSTTTSILKWDPVKSWHYDVIWLRVWFLLRSLLQDAESKSEISQAISAREHFVFTDTDGQVYHITVEGNTVKDGARIPPDVSPKTVCLFYVSLFPQILYGPHCSLHKALTTCLIYNPPCSAQVLHLICLQRF